GGRPRRASRRPGATFCSRCAAARDASVHVVLGGHRRSSASDLGAGATNAVQLHSRSVRRGAEHTTLYRPVSGSPRNPRGTRLIRAVCQPVACEGGRAWGLGAPSAGEVSLAPAYTAVIDEPAPPGCWRLN